MPDQETKSSTVWVMEKPESMTLVGGNPFRASRFAKSGEQLGVITNQFDLPADPVSPLGLHPAYVAIEKTLEAEKLIEKGEGRAPSVLFAVDALNGFIASKNGNPEVIYRGKPGSWGEIRVNFGLLSLTQEDRAVIQLEVAHALHYPENPNASFVAGIVHRGFLSPVSIAYLQSDEGFSAYQAIAEHYRLIKPLAFSGGVSWPTLFLLGLIERVDSIDAADSNTFARIKGKVITRATSFDSLIFETMLRKGQAGIAGVNVLSYLEYKKTCSVRS